MAVKKLTVNGITYHLPLEDRFRRHSEAEKEDMKKTVEAGGIRREIVLYFDKTLGLPNCVLDGQGRLEVARDLKLPRSKIPIARGRPKLTTEEAYLEALAHNDARRHDELSAIEYRREAIKAGRVKVVAEAKAEGKSTRQIAEEVGIDQKQVRRDLEAAAENPETAAILGGAPEKVVGRDGRPQAATKTPWRDKPLERFLSVDDNVWRALRHSGLKPESTAGELFDKLEAGNNFGLNPTAKGNLYLQINKLRPRDRPAKAAPGRVKGYDWRELEKALSVVAKAPGRIARVYGEDEERKTREYKSVTDLGTELGEAVKTWRTRLKAK